MGLFSKLFGSRDKPAALTFDLTDEETLEVNKMFDLLKDYAVHPDVADKLQEGLTARGLANYAADQIMYAGFRNENRDNCINKAIASIGKAYSIYQLPIYLYDLACYFELKNMAADTRKMYELFLVRQSEYKSDQLDHIFLGERNIDEAREQASQKLGGR